MSWACFWTAGLWEGSWSSKMETIPQGPRRSRACHAGVVQLCCRVCCLSLSPCGPESGRFCPSITPPWRCWVQCATAFRVTPTAQPLPQLPLGIEGRAGAPGSGPNISSGVVLNSLKRDPTIFKSEGRKIARNRNSHPWGFRSLHVAQRANSTEHPSIMHQSFSSLSPYAAFLASLACCPASCLP